MKSETCPPRFIRMMCVHVFKANAITNSYDASKAMKDKIDNIEKLKDGMQQQFVIMDENVKQYGQVDDAVSK